MNPKDRLAETFRILPMQEKALKRMGIETAEDLLYHFPSRYGSTADTSAIANLRAGDQAAIFGTLSGLKTSKAFRKKIPMAEGWVEDGTGKIKIIWFHQAYLAKMLEEGAVVRVEGKVSERNSQLYFSNPRVEKAPTLFNKTEAHALYPIYPETRGLSSNWLYHKIKAVLVSDALKEIEDPIPKAVLKKYSLPALRSALVFIHAPKTESDALA
ncbi:MAG: OB-fold nucleic acid binding domain-containing protein, partial [bacterium]|nr:OB-fold nucleic acid binding domain-containing protein [bacterium]